MTLTVGQTEQAKKLWKDGKTLGEIASVLECSIYDLSPWIYRQEIRAVFNNR